MKQKTLHIAILTLGTSMMLSACSSNDDSIGGGETTRYAITFGANDGQLQSVTRASSNSPLSDKGYTEMKVYGYKTLDSKIQNVMPGYTMKFTNGSANSSTTNSSGWEYVGLTDGSGAAVKDYLGLEQEIKYWDGNSTDYRFFGVLPTTSGDTKTYPKLTYKASSTATDESVTDNWKKQDLSTDGSFTLTFEGLKYMVRKQTDDSEDKAGSFAYYDADNKEVKETDIPIYCHLWQGNPAGTTGSSSAANYTQPVTLEFVKPYSLVRVAFERPAGSTTTQLGNPDEKDNSGNASDEHDITFGPATSSSTIATSGDVTITYPMKGSEETYAVNATTGSATTTTLAKMSLGTLTLTDENKQYQASPEYVMVPTNASDSAMVNGDFKCTAYIYTENSSSTTGGSYEERTATVPAQYMQWKPGYQYTYVFKVTANSGLEFSHVVEVYTKWQAGYVDETTW